ncbi:alpha/beta hydrolase [Williamsia sp. 1138]|uniref:alpha/beta fold hydrolase n=1 Tax=Williamsia sp. 1138 TaxID=1903117 RepID=UPI000A1020B4|nr:alpha/beta hydrolase [Williamsia sp. 1138]OZG29681.1 alpha/beta hydrolase [Williamsia sp. 1138]
MAYDLRPAPRTVTDWDDDRRKERLRETRSGGGRTPRRSVVQLGVALLAVVIVCTQYWVYDVAPERARLASTHPQVHHIYDAQDPLDQDTAVVDLVGLGNLDASATAMALPSFTRIGQVWAVQYDNSGLDTAVISRIIAQHALREGVDRIVLAGHSMGGIIALEVAEHIAEDTDLELKAVILDCTPINLHAVRAQSRDAGEDMLRWMGWLPGARESRSLRLLVETVARKDRYLFPSSGHNRFVDLGELTHVVDEVMHKKILSKNTASNGLIESQFRAIVASGAQDDLETLTSGDNSPAFVFLRPTFGDADPVVDVDYSQRALFEHTGGPDGRLLVVRMPGTGHANPGQQPVLYNRAIEDAIDPFLTELELRDGDSAVADAAAGRDRGAP